MRFILLAAALLSAPMAHAAGRSHCRGDETVAFSCLLSNGKTLSLCGSRDLGRLDGTLQYRFGKLGQKPELEYPAALEHPASHFRFKTVAYSGGIETWISFRSGAFRYVVFSGEGRGWEHAGVQVERSGRRLTTIDCRGRQRDAIMTPNRDEAWGLDVDDHDFEYRF